MLIIFFEKNNKINNAKITARPFLKGTGRKTQLISKIVFS